VTGNHQVDQQLGEFVTISYHPANDSVFGSLAPADPAFRAVFHAHYDRSHVSSFA
jgi:hypothetical protein